MKKYQAKNFTYPSNDLLSLTIILFSILVLTACGGGGGGGGGPLGGSPTATVSSGEVQGFGSVIVNGVRFDTSSATFEVENQASASQDDLQLGMQVTVEGTTNSDGINGTATAVSFEDNLEGPIASVTASDTGLSKTLMVLGQMVRVESGATMFDNSDAPGFTFANLETNIGTVVEVSGHDMADGSIQATFIQKKADNLTDFFAAGGELELKGNIENLDTTAQTFNINGQFIDYSGATLFDLDNAPNGELANGVPVEVKSLDNNLADLTLSADSVEVKLQGLGQDNVPKVEIEGFISGLDTGGQTFMINGQMVNYANAAFRGGLEEELANDVKVEAEGPMSNGTLMATKVTFKESVKFEANIDQINPNGSMTLQGLPGISVRADSSITRFDNFGALSALSPGNNVRVRARPSGGGLVATRVILRDAQADDRVIVQAQVDANGIDGAAGTVSMLNGAVIVDTNEIVASNSIDDSPGDSDFEIEDTPVSQGAFFAALVDGDTVKARARLESLAGDAKTWHAIEIEVEDD